jgi:hypothetical protein
METTEKVPASELPKMQLTKEIMMNPPQDLIQAAEDAFSCQAWTRIIRTKIEKWQQEVLNKFNYKVAPQWVDAYEKVGEEMPEFIKTHDKMYLSNEKDFAHYMTEMYQRRKDEFPIAFEYCPLPIAEEMERDANRNLVVALEPYTGMNVDNLIYTGMKVYERYLEINKGWLSHHVRPVEQIMKIQYHKLTLELLKRGLKK